MDIDKLGAGREIDALVAEKGMGFKREKTPKDYDGNFGGEDVLVPPTIELKSWAYQPKGRIALTYFVPKYSTDIKAAWLVFEKLDMPCLIAKSYKDTHGEGPIGYTVNWCDVALCECMEGEKCSNGNEVWAETAPLAICKAALMIKEATP